MIRALIKALRTGRKSEDVTPDDDAVIAVEMRELHCGGEGGTVVGFLREDDTTGNPRTFYVNQGDGLPYDFKVVKTDTEATGLVAIR